MVLLQLCRWNLEVFTQRNFVAEFIRFKLIFIHKKMTPFVDLGVTWTSSIAGWKGRGRFPIRDN